MPDGNHATGGGRMGFAHVGRAEGYNVLPILPGMHDGQLVELTLVDDGPFQIVIRDFRSAFYLNTFKLFPQPFLKKSIRENTAA